MVGGALYIIVLLFFLKKTCEMVRILMMSYSIQHNAYNAYSVKTAYDAYSVKTAYDAYSVKSAYDA